MPPSLAPLAKAGRRWLLEAMLPLWSTAGFDDSTSQFVEALTPAGEPLPLPRRILVQARQMFVVCAGGRLGWTGSWRELAVATGEALLAHGRNDAGDWIYSFDSNGAPADARTDLYTQAFVIFGLAEAGRALGRGDFVAAATATCQRLETGWADPAGGFFEGDFAPHPGRQNPHMHLLEAFLALHGATGNPTDLARAERIADLSMTRLLAVPGCIPEEFDVAWAPIASGGLAPGHQFEWAWLLDRLRQGGGQNRSEAVERLVAFGERHGINAAGFALDEIWPDGSVKSAEARLWPQAERLKAALMAADDQAAAQAAKALNAYLDMPVPGTWRDARLPDGVWRGESSPASSGYHIVSALQTLIETVGARSDV
jgi:mannose/cellobiose epimerase-like protein (N-acyl-D-glucosamine 2-epimerase family)